MTGQRVKYAALNLFLHLQVQLIEKLTEYKSLLSSIATDERLQKLDKGSFYSFHAHDEMQFLIAQQEGNKLKVSKYTVVMHKILLSSLYS